MSTKKSPRVLNEERTVAAGAKKCATFAAANAGAIRSIELNNIAEGEIVTIPVDYQVFQQPIPGSTYTAAKVVTEEGKDFFVGCLTRGAQPVAGGEYVRPKGTVVEAAQKYASMDEFFKAEMAGKKIKFTKKEVVVAQGFVADTTRNVNVWTLDFEK